MKRLFALAFVCLSTLASATVTVSGNLQDPSGTAVSSRAFVRFSIRGCGGNQPRVTGTAVIIPPYQDFTSTAGAISGTIYDSLTEISCGGSVGNTWYGITVYRDGKPGPEVPYNVTGASFNLNSATPNTTSPVVSAPTGDSTYCRIDAGNCGFSGTVSPASSNTYDLGSTAAKWRTGYFGTGIRVNDVDLTRSAADTLQLATGDSFIPQSSGQLLGGTSNRWAGAFSTADIGTSATSPAFISSTTNPASAGLIRLAKSDALNFRNNANGADVGGVSLNSSDQVVVGGSAGIVVGGTVNGTAAMTVKPSSTCNHCSSTFAASDATSNGSSGGDVILTTGNGLGVGKAGRVLISPPSNGNALPAGVASSASLVYSTNTNLLYLSLNADAMAPVLRTNCSTSQKSESAADTNVLTCTPPAVAGSYRIRFTADVSAQNTATLGWTATWTDANAHAQAPTNLALFKAGTAAPALTFVAATNDHYYGYIDVDTDASATAIVVKLTFAGTSFTALASATVERIQ